MREIVQNEALCEEEGRRKGEESTLEVRAKKGCVRRGRDALRVKMRKGAKDSDRVEITMDIGGISSILELIRKREEYEEESGNGVVQNEKEGEIYSPVSLFFLVSSSPSPSSKCLGELLANHDGRIT